MIEDKVVDKEVKEQEFALYLNNLLKQYELQKFKIDLEVGKVSEVIQDIRMYKGLNFKIKYFYNEENKEYYYKFMPKDEAGFKK